MLSSFAISQILVVVAACFDIASFQYRSRKAILACLAISSILIGSHFFLLAKVTAGSCSLLTAARFLIAYRSSNRIWMWFFLAVVTAVFAITYEAPLNILPFVGSMMGTIGSFQHNDKTLRRCVMFATSAWLLHNLLIWSPAAFALESAFLASNLVGYWRYYIRPRSVESHVQSAQ